MAVNPELKPDLERSKELLDPNRPLPNVERKGKQDEFDFERISTSLFQYKGIRFFQQDISSRI